MSYIPQIAIEGNDLTGKTTLQKALFRTKPESLGKMLFISDRNVLTQYVYSQYFDRYKGLHVSWAKDFKNFVCNNGVIFLTLKDETIKKRFEARGDDTYKLPDILGMNSLYNSYADMFKNIPFVKVIAADDLTVDQTVKAVEDWFMTMTRCTMSHKVANLYSAIYALGHDFEKGFLEMQNVQLQEHSNIIAPEQFSKLMEYFGNYSLTVLNHAEYDMAIDNHTLFYKAFGDKLAYVIMKEMRMNKENPITSRRFHVTNDQGGCLNTLGILFRKNNTNGVDMYITANLRSSDIAILPFDIFGIYSICRDIIRPKTAKKILLNGITEKIQNFYTTVNIESAHMLNPEKMKEFDDHHHNRTA